MSRTSGIVCILALLAASAEAGLGRPTNAQYKAAKAAEAGKAADAVAKQKGMGAVNKVIELLDHLRAQVVANGETESKSYDTYACWCKTSSGNKAKDIASGKDEVASLSSQIKKLNSQTEDLRTTIANRNAAIDKAGKDLAMMNEAAAVAMATFSKNEADLAAAVSGVQNALGAMKAGKSASLLQLQSASKAINNALMFAEALGLSSAQSVGESFLQKGPEVEMENFKHHSGGIITTLEKLVGDFRAKVTETDADEAKRVASHNIAVQNNKDMTADKKWELENAKEELDMKVAETSQKFQLLAVTSANLADDKAYLSTVSQGCSDKAATWDQRMKLMAKEIQALTTASDIVKSSVAGSTGAGTVRLAQLASSMHSAEIVASDEESMEALEAAAEGAPMSFLQKAQKKPLLSLIAKKNVPEREVAKQMVMSLLSSKGQELKSAALMGLASEISADPFAKITKLVQELIERLLQQAANEANQKGWCDKAESDASQRRDYASEKTAALSAEMERLEANIGVLNEDLALLAAEIKEIKASRSEANAMRKGEKAENQATSKEAQTGLDAVEKAMDILVKFYKTAAKSAVASFVQTGNQVGYDDAPETFKSGEAYTGSQGASTGVIGMMEVIASDFKRTISTMQEEEASAEEQHLEFTTATGMSLAAKGMAVKQKTKYLNEAEARAEDAEDNFDAQTAILQTAKKELAKLEPVCHEKSMSYADRVAMREQEVASLRKAMCLLGSDNTEDC